MRPVVDLYKLGRMSYARSLNVQHALFDDLKKRVIPKSEPTFNTSRAYDSKGIPVVESDERSIVGDGSVNQFASSLADVQNQRHRQQQSTLKTSNFPKANQNTIVARNSLLLVEHEPVYTIGIRASQYDDNYVSILKTTLAEHKLKADFVKTNRGGLITFHGPGQLVAYPIIYLGDFSQTIPKRSVKAYVQLLETIVIDTLCRVGLEGAHTVQGYPGVWLDGGERKIAFIGISCKRYVAMHGISINCDCDLSWFDHIVSCGIEDKKITSVQQELIGARIIGKHTGEGNHKTRKSSLNEPINQAAPVESTSHHSTGSSYLARIEPPWSLEQVAESFCRSFAHHLNCELTDQHANCAFLKP